MPIAASITPAIVDALYAEALTLAEEARLVFETDRAAARPCSPAGQAGRADGLAAARAALALRTTTRIMHALAFLLNLRAYFSGNLSEFQLRRFGRLPPDQPENEAPWLAADPAAAALVARSVAFYARLARLDAAWRAALVPGPSAIERLRQRLGSAYAAGAQGIKKGALM